MERRGLTRILDELEPGMSLTIPRDWFSLNIDGENESARDLNTIALAGEHDCVWERDPKAATLTFTKQPTGDR